MDGGGKGECKGLSACRPLICWEMNQLLFGDDMVLVADIRETLCKLGTNFGSVKGETMIAKADKSLKQALLNGLCKRQCQKEVM